MSESREGKRRDHSRDHEDDDASKKDQNKIETKEKATVTPLTRALTAMAVGRDVCAK